MGKLPDFELLRKNVSQMLGVEVDDDVRSGRYNGREGYYSRISRRDLTNWNEEQIEKLKQAFEKTNLESENYEFEYHGVSDFEVEPGERDYPASFDYFATEKLGYLKETTISRGIEVEVTGNNIMVNGSPLRRINVATVGFSDRIYRGYLFTDEGQINLDGGESGLFEFYDAVGAGRGAEAREFFEKYGVEIMSSEFDVS